MDKHVSSEFWFRYLKPLNHKGKKVKLNYKYKFEFIIQLGDRKWVEQSALHAEYAYFIK